MKQALWLDMAGEAQVFFSMSSVSSLLLS